MEGSGRRKNSNTYSGKTGVKDGDALKGADGTQYQVASAKDKTVIITKGVDAKTIKVGPTVVINKETYKVIGIGSKAYTDLKKATKVVINAKRSKLTVKWGKVKGKQRTQLKKALKKAKLKVK